MRNVKHNGVIIFVSVLAALVLPLIYFLQQSEPQRDDPWAFVPEKLPHTDHANLMKGPFEDGPSVTKACLECHKDAGTQMMNNAHWTWETPETLISGRSEPVKLGKKNAMNNFCIGIQSNWPPCTACHAGYGWKDETFDFTRQENMDCLVCHDNSGEYVKANGGFPAEGVDLLAVAKSVGNPKRSNCGGCHFRGGGGNAVKHGDLDESLYFPQERVDVHMGKFDFVCTDCHQSENHSMKGRAFSVSFDNENQVYCTNCHSETLHSDDRINAHIANVACQSCHIPAAAVKEATKMHWDWSAAGQDLPEDPHTYLKIKGKFEYEKEIIPEYFWYNGVADHYILGDKIDPAKTTFINYPKGNLKDPKAKIWPFKVHRAKQIYDTEYNHLIQPKTFGEGGYWKDFDWDKAARLGSEVVGLPYSGRYGFTETEMFWPITHMVAPKENALQCVDCHGDAPRARMDWHALGYDGDPMYHGGRRLTVENAAAAAVSGGK